MSVTVWLLYVFLKSLFLHSGICWCRNEASKSVITDWIFPAILRSELGSVLFCWLCCSVQPYPGVCSLCRRRVSCTLSASVCIFVFSFFSFLFLCQMWTVFRFPSPWHTLNISLLPSSSAQQRRKGENRFRGGKVFRNSFLRLAARIPLLFKHSNYLGTVGGALTLNAKKFRHIYTHKILKLFVII